MLGQQLALPVELLRTTIVGPQVGAELFQQGMLAVLVASLAISAYLAVRFRVAPGHRHPGVGVARWSGGHGAARAL